MIGSDSGAGEQGSMAEAAPETPVNEDGCEGCGVREPDQFLPIANIGRIMRRAVPENGKIAKEAKESVQECVSEFISFITSEATDKCQRERRKTVNGEDLLWAMGTLGFDDYIEPLKLYLQLYRQCDGKGRRDDLFNGEPGILRSSSRVSHHTTRKYRKEWELTHIHGFMWFGLQPAFVRENNQIELLEYDGM